MTIKGLKKIFKEPHIFLKDYIKKTKTEDEQKELLEKLMKLDIPFDKLYFFLSKEVSKKKKNTVLEKELLEKAYLVSKKSEYLYKVASILKAKKQWWQSAEAFSKLIELSSNSPKAWYKEYATILTQMNRHVDASKAWEKAIIGSKNANDWFLYGYSLELSGQIELSKQAYDKAIQYDKDKDSKKLGIGIFHEKRGHWIPAVNAYSKYLEENGINTNSQYKYSLSLERCYNWNKSEEEILLAISLDSKRPYWYYKLGFIRERMGLFKKASEAYSHAIENKKIPDKYWYYRLGYTLRKAGEYEASCDAFLMMKDMKLFTTEEGEKIFSYNGLIDNIEIEEYFEIDKEANKKETLDDKIYNDIKIQKELSIAKIKQLLSKDTTILNNWKMLAKLYRDIGKYKESIEALYHLLNRTNDFDKNLYIELAEVLVLNGDYEEASIMFVEQRILQEAHGVLETPYNKDKKLQKTINYTEYYECYEIEDKTILYESYHGRSISCNPYALFKEIYNDKRFSGYKHVWAINNMDVIPKNLKSDINIIFVKRESDLYLRYLTKAKYLINNTSFSDYFIRKEKQVYLNTWHGTPVKLMGKDAKDEFLSHKNITRNFLHTSHLIHPNRYTLDIMLESYDIKNIYEGVIAEIGYPRQDLMINISKDDKEKLFEQLKIDKDKKVVLYAPTWRGTGVSDVEFDKEKLLKDLNLLSQLENIQLLYRGHYMAEKFIQEVSTLQDMIVPSSIDTNSLLSIVDVLITDYSSIAFDFMALEKPIIYYAYDQDEYQNERGLKFDLEEISENVCKDNQQLSTLLEKVVKNPTLDKKQIKAQDKFCAYDDGKASKRVVDLLFFNKKDKKYIVEFERKESILFYGGTFTPYGITTSLLNLIANINHEKYDVNIVLEPNEIKNNQQRIEQLNRLPDNISLLGKFGKMNVSLEEKWIIDKFNSQRELASSEMWQILYYAYNREFLRVFGHTKFNYIINFEGYNAFWIRLFARDNSTLYLHNEMLGEAKAKYSGLYGVFKIYKKYSTLISVSLDVDKANKENLSESYNIPIEKFKYCDNLLNSKEILYRAEEDFEFSHEKEIFNNGKVFINMARLSPEKDQRKLIYAFSRIVKKYKGSKLVILGQGPLESDLKSLVRELAMHKNIFILGQRFNPMPYLKASDCFVLSSNHEGQGLVLLEAMILNKSVISTDIVGPRSVLEGRPGLLVENSEDGLYNGMLDFLEGRYKEDKNFDYEEYNQNALNMFYEKVLKKEE